MLRALIVASLVCAATVAAAGSLLACTIDIVPVAFGTVQLDRISRATGRIALECDVAAVAEIGLSGAEGGQLRTLVGPGGKRIFYQLARDPAFRQIWGDSGSGRAVSVAISPGKPARLTVYGVVPAQPSVPEGQYADQLIVTVTY